MEIKDNFLKQEDFDKIQKLMMNHTFSWFYGNYIVFRDDIDRFRFFHYIYANGAPQSPFYNDLLPLIDIIQPLAMWRAVANLLTKTTNIEEYSFHVDMNGIPDEKIKQWTTAIFYVNTNNGYTKFENGTKVASVANRMLTFPTNMKHTGTSCTDEKIRVMINFLILPSI